MIHQFRDKKQIERKKRLTKNFIFSLLFLLLAAGGVYSFFGGGIHFVGKFIWGAKKNIVESVNNNGNLVRSKSSVFKDNERLSQENVDLRKSMVDYQILKDENIMLKEIFGRKPEDKNLVLANILTKPNYSPYDTIIIDIGSDENLNQGDKVYSNEIIPIGEVGAVYDDTSLVTLYSNPGQTTEAMIEGSNTSVELVGRGGGNFEMIIPVDLSFTKGSSVYLPGLSSEVVAIIEDVISLPNDPVKKVLLSSPVNVQGLKWVFVKK